MPEENKIRDVADAVKGIVEAVPVYQDVIQPAAKEVGVALHTVTKTLHVLLAPVSGLVWGYERIKDFVSEKVAEKLKNLPEEQMQSPEPHVAGPALEALKYTGYQEKLREMYANLLATSIDSQTSSAAHPAFVEIIRQLSPDEALIMNFISKNKITPKIDVRSEERNSKLGHWKLRNFSLLPKNSGCAHCELGSNYLINLQRLGLIELREKYKLSITNVENIYQLIEESPEIQLLKNQIEINPEKKMAIDYGAVMLTELGEQFCYSCIYEGTHVPKNG